MLRLNSLFYTALILSDRHAATAFICFSVTKKCRSAKRGAPLLPENSCFAKKVILVYIAEDSHHEGDCCVESIGSQV